MVSPQEKIVSQIKHLAMPGITAEKKPEKMIGSLAFVIEKPYLFTVLNVISGFFLLFDVTMDISHGKVISEKFGHTDHANFPRYKDHLQR